MKTAAKELNRAGIKIAQCKPGPTSRLAVAIAATRELNTEELKKLKLYLAKGRDTKSMRDVRNAVGKLPEGIQQTIHDLVFAHSCALCPPDNYEPDDDKIMSTFDDLYSVLNPEEYFQNSMGEDPTLDAVLESVSVA